MSEQSTSLSQNRFPENASPLLPFPSPIRKTRSEGDGTEQEQRERERERNRRDVRLDATSHQKSGNAWRGWVWPPLCDHYLSKNARLVPLVGRACTHTQLRIPRTRIYVTSRSIIRLQEDGGGTTGLAGLFYYNRLLPT